MDGGGKSVPPKRNSGLRTRNATIKGWWPEKEDLDEVLNISPEDKIKEYPEQRFTIRVAYQCPLNVKFKDEEGEALTNTLEDALVFQNLEYFSNAQGTGLLGRFKRSIEKTNSVANLGAALCSDLNSTAGKAEFALDLLEIENPKSFQAPLYIAEGLSWLAKHLQKQHQELGVASAAASKPDPAGAK